MVKSFAAGEKPEVVTEWSHYDGDALQRYVFEQSRSLEIVHAARLN